MPPLVLQLEGRVLPSFLAPLAYDAGAAPLSVAVGDFNGDGSPDLAVVDEGSNSVRVLLGNGDGTLLAAGNYSVGGLPDAVVVGHFHDPNILDLAVANLNSDTVSVLLGNGDGTFQAARNYTAGTGPNSLAVGDFNGDGLLDLAVVGYGRLTTGGYYDETVRVLLGNGDGSFQAPRIFDLGTRPDSVAVGDEQRRRLVPGRAELQHRASGRIGGGWGLQRRRHP
jgi:hypothetical protein